MERVEEEEVKPQKREQLDLKEPERRVLAKVGHLISSINSSKHVDQVISALHSFACLLFPMDSLSLLGSISEKYRDEVINSEVATKKERSENWRIFYRGAAFRALARVLLYDVALDWLACFPTSAKKLVYDVFFVYGRVTEVVQTLVPCLQNTRANSDRDIVAVCSNTERLLVLCLLENNGVLQITREFAASSQDKELTSEQLKQDVFSIAQLITSIPDKQTFTEAGPLGGGVYFGLNGLLGGFFILISKSSPFNIPFQSLLLCTLLENSSLFFKQITAQLLAGAEEQDKSSYGEAATYNVDGPMSLIGETFARICRRGSADMLVSEVTCRILGRVRSFLSGNTETDVEDAFEREIGLHFWSKLLEAVKDPYSIERMSEQLLHQLAAQSANDVEAYWIMRLLFYRIYKHQKTIRSMFMEKFLLWKVFPVCCLSWILHFAIFECKPGVSLPKEAFKATILSDTVQRLASAWSKREFVQSAAIEQQIYVTAALGYCLEKMSREDLDATKDAMHSILQGVSCRLESVDYLIRKMACNIALVFSKVIDPQNPLYLDDSCHEDTIDWEFGLGGKEKSFAASSDCRVIETNRSKKVNINHQDDSRTVCIVNNMEKKPSEFRIVDPDEIVDPATLSNYFVSDEDGNDNPSEDSDASSDSSLQPYDLSDDDTDLKKKFSQLVDVVGALRKSDDADAVEGALDVAEMLIRASPDELKYVAGDLVRTLVQVRCSDSAVEGKEESAEEKRQKALVALVVTCPLESLDTLNKLLYSSSLDVSQRIMILDIMTDAAHELAHSKVPKPGIRPTALISSMSDQPWFVPKSAGPPGAGGWKEISTPDTPLNWSHSYERELPAKPGQIKRGKTRRWSLKSSSPENQPEWSQNKFPQHAAAFMLPAMQGFDKKRHGVDLVDRDFVVLGKVIYMLGVCMKCAAMHPEATVVASPLLDMLSSREISHHKEAYVRRSVLFAASCTLIALHPSYVASALTEGKAEISAGLEWVRTYALHIVESDIDRDCYTLAMTCLRLHSEMALQASRALESAEEKFGAKTVGLPSNMKKGTIRIPRFDVEV